MNSIANLFYSEGIIAPKIENGIVFISKQNIIKQQEFLYIGAIATADKDTYLITIQADFTKLKDYSSDKEYNINIQGENNGVFEIIEQSSNMINLISHQNNFNYNNYFFDILIYCNNILLKTEKIKLLSKNIFSLSYKALHFNKNFEVAVELEILNNNNNNNNIPSQIFNLLIYFNEITLNLDGEALAFTNWETTDGSNWDQLKIGTNWDIILWPETDRFQWMSNLQYQKRKYHTENKDWYIYPEGEGHITGQGIYNYLTHIYISPASFLNYIFINDLHRTYKEPKIEEEEIKYGEIELETGAHFEGHEFTLLL